MNEKVFENIGYSDSDPYEFNNKPVLIFLHAFFMDKRMFKNQVKYFKSRYRVICIDVRGFGDSVNNGESFNLYDLANDVITVANSLGINKFYICGLSMGGYIAMRLGLIYPERLSGMVLMATQADVDKPEIINTYLFLRDNWNNKEIKSRMIDGLLPVIIGENKDEQNFWRTAWFLRDFDSIYHAMNAMIYRDDISDKLSECKFPVLILHGENDHGILPKAGKRIHKIIKGSTLVIIPQASHALNISHNENVNNEIDKWLDNLVSSD